VRSLMKPLASYFSKKKLTSITHEMIGNYCEKRLKTPVKYKFKKSRKRSYSSINRELEVLKAMFNVAISQGWLQSNPFYNGRKLISHAREKIRTRIMTYEEQAKILELCLSEKKWAHLYPFIIVAVSTGMRPGEIQKLKVQDLHFDKQYIQVEYANTKDEETRRVPLSNKAAQVLKEVIKNKRPNSLIFGVKNQCVAFRRLSKLAGADGLTLYCLRHTYATRLATNGVSIEDLAITMGHKSLQSTYNYIHQTLESIHQLNKMVNANNRRLQYSED
jgi:integrase